MTDRDAFLAGDRPDDVLVYLAADVLGNPDALADVGETVDDGVVLVVPGDQGRQSLQSAVGVDPMGFAQDAVGTEGEVARDCTDATCPQSGDGDDHALQFLFAFAEAENPEAGGLYAEGDVVHAYAQCACGERYSDRWVAEA
jgi:hypothetical protein